MQNIFSYASNIIQSIDSGWNLQCRKFFMCLNLFLCMNFQHCIFLRFSAFFFYAKKIEWDEKLHNDGEKNVKKISVVFTLVLNHALPTANGKEETSCALNFFPVATLVMFFHSSMAVLSTSEIVLKYFFVFILKFNLFFPLLFILHSAHE